MEAPPLGWIFEVKKLLLNLVIEMAAPPIAQVISDEPGSLEEAERLLELFMSFSHHFHWLLQNFANRAC